MPAHWSSPAQAGPGRPRSSIAGKTIKQSSFAPGRGKGAKGLGKGGAKRHRSVNLLIYSVSDLEADLHAYDRKILRDNIAGISK
jgi:hypothetical protein